jgi:hypothetical protein
MWWALQICSDCTMNPINSIPSELTTRPQWVAWWREVRDGKETKVPYSPVTGKRASVMDKRTWGSFQLAWRFSQMRGYDGVGFVLTAGAEIVGLDLDDCRNPKTGQIAPWAQGIIEKVGSHTEISPSGSGIRIFTRGSLPNGVGGRKKGLIELYSHSRYLTVTGNHVEGTPRTLEARIAVLADLYASLDTNPDAQSQSRYEQAKSIQIDDAELLDKAQRAADGQRFARLWKGDIAGYPSHSEADLALCSSLAFWTNGEANRMDRLFRHSGLYRKKWDARHGDPTYGQRTIRKVLSTLREGYQPKHKAALKAGGPAGPSGPSPIQAQPEAVDQSERSSGPAAVQCPPVPGYRISADGVFEVPEDRSKPETRLTLAPCGVLAHCRDGTQQNWGAYLRWRDRDGRIHEAAFPVGRFHESGGMLPVELANAGLPIMPGMEKKLLRYLANGNPATRYRAAIQTGWQDGTDVFVLPSGSLEGANEHERTVYQPDRYTPTRQSVRTAGTFEEWQTTVAVPCAENPVLVFWLSGSFGAPLLHLLGLEGGGFHLYGLTSQGKTTAEQVAASVWGDGTDPAEGRLTAFVKKWNQTKNATEGLAEAHNDLPLCLDEIGEADAREFGHMIYQLAGGQGKGRMLADATLKRSKVWRTLLLSTGEVPTTDVLESEGRRLMGGQAVRLVDLPATDPTTGQTIIVNTHETSSPALFADQLKRACGTHFGWAGPAFVKALMDGGVGLSSDRVEGSVG